MQTVIFLWPFLFSNVYHFVTSAYAEDATDAVIPVEIKTLHHFCLRNITRWVLLDDFDQYTLYSPYSMVLMCSAIVPYFKCYLEHRDLKSKHIDWYDIRPMEYYFPESYNIIRATYLYCMDMLPKRWAEIERLRQPAVVSCVERLDTDKCEKEVAVGNLKLKQLFNSVANRNNTLVWSNSCRMTVNYYNCLQQLHMSCHDSYHLIFSYYISAVGSACLMQVEHYQSLILEIVCTKYQSISRAATLSLFTSKVQETSVVMICVCFLLMSVSRRHTFHLP